MAATRKTATPPPRLPPLEAGIASTGEEASVHNNRYEHKHNVNTANVRGKEKAERGKINFCSSAEDTQGRTQKKFKFSPNFKIIT
jgi:hypothetical protein